MGPTRDSKKGYQAETTLSSVVLPWQKPKTFVDFVVGTNMGACKSIQQPQPPKSRYFEVSAEVASVTGFPAAFVALVTKLAVGYPPMRVVAEWHEPDELLWCSPALVTRDRTLVVFRCPWALACVDFATGKTMWIQKILSASSCVGPDEIVETRDGEFLASIPGTHRLSLMARATGNAISLPEQSDEPFFNRRLLSTTAGRTWTLTTHDTPNGFELRVQRFRHNGHAEVLQLDLHLWADSVPSMSITQLGADYFSCGGHVLFLGGRRVAEEVDFLYVEASRSRSLKFIDENQCVELHGHSTVLLFQRLLDSRRFQKVQRFELSGFPQVLSPISPLAVGSTGRFVLGFVCVGPFVTFLDTQTGECWQESIPKTSKPAGWVISEIDDRFCFLSANTGELEFYEPESPCCSVNVTHSRVMCCETIDGVLFVQTTVDERHRWHIVH